MGIINSLTLCVMLAMNGCPFFGNHARREPKPETEKMGHDGMQLQCAVRLAAMQKNRHTSNGDVGENQRENEDLPPSPV
jgi:hypothetical protein